MGLSNLKENLQRKFADWLGEQQELEKHVAEVTAAYEALGKKRERLEAVNALLDSTKVCRFPLRFDPVGLRFFIEI